MPAFTHHIFVCCNQRSPGHRRGCCDPEGSERLRNAFKNEIAARQLGPLVRANKSGCLEQCEHGPTVAIYPQGIFYGHVTVDDVPRIIEQTVIRGEVIPDLQIAESCLNNPDCEHIRANVGRPSEAVRGNDE
jgi:(2Fe-2S) ferredoxin